MRELWAEHRGICLLVFAFLALGVVYAWATPPFEASDEAWHYPYVRHLAQGNGLPVQDSNSAMLWRQEGSQPPLYYAVAALCTFWIDTDDAPQFLRRNPHALIGVPEVDGSDNRNMLVPIEPPGFPVGGTLAAVYMIRALSLVMASGTLALIYLIALEVFPGRKGLAVGAAAVGAFVPQFLFIGASVNNDNLITLLAAAVLLVIVRVARGGSDTRSLVVLGALMGLAALTKISGLGLLPLAAIVLAMEAFRKRSLVVRDWLIVFGLAAAIAGWWYARNYSLYGDPLGLNMMLEVVGKRHPEPTLWQLLQSESEGFWVSFWGLFGGVNILAEGWVYHLYAGMTLLAGIGLLVALVRWLRASGTRMKWPLPILIGWLAILCASLIRWTLVTPASQGRLIFPALPVVAVLMVLGLASLIPQRLARWLPGVLGVPLFAVAAAVLFLYIMPAYAHPPTLTGDEVPESCRVTPSVFDGKMALVGFEVETDTVEPGDLLPVTAYWEALSRMDEDYSVFVQVLGQGEIIWGQRDTYPGLGLRPTSRLREGQVVRDVYRIPISSAAFAPDDCEVRMGLYRWETGERLPVRMDGVPGGDHVSAGSIRLLPGEGWEPGSLQSVYFNLDDRVALVGYSLDRRSAAPGDSLNLSLQWQALRSMDRDYTVFTHLIGPQQDIRAQSDAQPQEGNSPTSHWQPGELVTDTHRLVVKDDTLPGVYQIELGMYMASTGDRLRVFDEGGQLVGNQVFLGGVRVLPTP